MRESGHRASPRARTTTGTAAQLARDLHDRHATVLYRQALLTLENASLAERVVCDVIVAECARRLAAGPAGPAAQTSQDRLAVAVYRHCQAVAGAAVCQTAAGQLPSGQGTLRQAASGQPALTPIAPRPPAPRQAALGRIERGALGLVLFGGLDYVEAASTAGISAASMGRLLRAVLLGRSRSADAWA